jgi:protein O-GlcNAc transferase
VILSPSPQDSASLAVEQVLQQAITHHQAGQFTEAEERYLSVLQAEPKHPDANHNLGLMAMQLGKAGMGFPYLQVAWETSPSVGQYWLTLTECLLEMGHAEDALLLIEDAIRRGIESPQAQLLLMRAKDDHDNKVPPADTDVDEAVEALAVDLEGNSQIVAQPNAGYQQALQEPPPASPTVAQDSKKNSKLKSAKPNKSVGKSASHKEKNPSPKEIDALVTLFSRGRYAEAETFAQTMTVRYPRHGFGWKALGALLVQTGRSVDALVPLQKAAALSPSDAEAHYNLGFNLNALGRLGEAEVSYRRALQIKPGNAMAHHSLGATLKDLGRLQEAETSYRRALQIKPDYAETHSNLGVILKDQGHLNEAEASSSRALQIKPDYAEAHSNLGGILKDLGHLDEAEISFRRALEIKPDFSGAHSNLLFCLTHNEKINAQVLFAEHCRFGEQFEAPLRTGWLQHANSKNPERCLQVGFVSADLYNHAVANFIEPLLMHLAKYPQLSLHAYSNSYIEDDSTQRLRGYFKHWHSITALSDAALAEKIRADGIDILIDLSGHTAKNRLLTFARKPAPVQASWMGYPGTTGLQAMDYYLTDHFLLPPGRFDDQFTEKIVHLPASAPFMPFKSAPPVNALPALSRGYVTFGSFNRLSKLSPFVIALWAQLLRALPDSRMLLGAMPQDGKHDALIESFAREGVASERLSFHSRCNMEDYLALHQQVDICLDTFPYTGGTTTHHALWMGVPTLTLAGHTVPGRQGACILGNVGLEAFVAEGAADFVRKGLSWAGNLSALADLRDELRERVKQSPQGQPELIAGGLERALRIMWQRWCAGLPAESFEVSRQNARNAVAEESQNITEFQKIPPIYVTQPLLPPLEEFIPYLQKIWDSKCLTNNGPFHQQLEQALCDYLGVKHVALFANGTLALMTAMQALRITGEVITSPYSFVATAHSLLWNGIKPVFVDIDPITLNLDPNKIEAAITPQTTAIMPVHCYGHPCDVKRIQKIADNYGLKVIYDAAHAFGVQGHDGSVLNHGDLSVLSFHATKVFNTFEGGAIICPDAKTKQRIYHLKNFGFVDEVTVVAAGINGKMSEVNAAFGLLQLKHVDQALQMREAIDARYRKALAGVKDIHCLPKTGEKVANYAYFPVLVQPGYPLNRDALYQKLRDNGVYARRYFFPLVSDFPMYRGMPSAAHSNLPVAKKVAEQVICLPIYPDLSNEQVDFIIGLISG